MKPDSAFFKKQIQAVARTYTNSEMDLPLTEEEEAQLLHGMQQKLEAEPEMELHEVVHDVVYRFFADQEE
ncbi:YqzH family protein [Halalkalibacter oceani]|uniref:YqzH family protein n=1 Tax=Halalkalibacter oceani TaxID=1653776 RepID=A0A9X2IPX3_9BACI|nr:YqzH family protein [Halalkalibacter oceani]MCM3714877.1 YqzH family protein [Halalkalibacter oceani]